MAGTIIDMQSVHYNTPEAILGAVRDVFGGSIGLDPCDNEYSLTQPLISYRLPEVDGLEAPWEADTVFCNPPFGRTILSPERKILTPDEYKALSKAAQKTCKKTSIADWVKKAFEEDEPGQIILLLPAATEASFWHEYIWPKAEAICFIKGRVSFLLEGQPTAAAPKGTALVYLGVAPYEFRRRFSTDSYWNPDGNGLGKVVMRDD